MMYEKSKVIGFKNHTLLIMDSSEVRTRDLFNTDIDVVIQDGKVYVLK